MSYKNEFMTTKNVCDYLKCSISTVGRLASSGKINTYPPQDSGMKRYLKSDIDRYMGINNNSNQELMDEAALHSVIDDLLGH